MTGIKKLTCFRIDSFNAVKEFLEGSRTLSGGKPFLFCQSTWLQRQNMDDIFIDRFGNLATDFDNEGKLIYVKIKEVEHMTTARQLYGGYPVSATDPEATWPIRKRNSCGESTTASRTKATCSTRRTPIEKSATAP